LSKHVFSLIPERPTHEVHRASPTTVLP
jgi:hypothetical protein